MVMYYAVCKCSFVIWKRSKKDFKKDLENNGSYGFHKIDNSHYGYARNSNCNICQSPLLITDRYSDKSLLSWVKSYIGKNMVESYPNSPISKEV